MSSQDDTLIGFACTGSTVAKEKGGPRANDDDRKPKTIGGGEPKTGTLYVRQQPRGYGGRPKENTLLARKSYRGAITATQACCWAIISPPLRSRSVLQLS